MSIISIGIPLPYRSALPGQTGDGNEVNLQYATQNYCDGTGIFAPTVATPAGGTFTDNSSDPNLFQVNSSNGTFNLGVSDPGNYIVTYTVAGVGSANFPINISALDDASFSYSASAFCANASNQTPTIATPGGTFTSQDITFRPFQMQFEVASGTQKTISISGIYGTSFTIDWGDGFTETSTGSGNRTISHIYNDGNNTDVTNPTVSIGAEGDSGAFNRFSFAGSGGSGADLLDVPQWGNIAWQSFNGIFTNCNNINFQISATDAPDLSNITNMSYLFYNATHFNSSIDHWDVSSITNISGAFRGCNNFNQSLNSWDVSNVTNFGSMFLGSSSFNGNISNWDMSSCQTTVGMFYSASSFNQDISGWNFSSAWTSANNMFLNASSFNQNVGSWNVSNITNMSYMFYGCTNFNNNGGTLSGWNVSSVTTMNRMFQSASSFVGTGLDSWNPSLCTNFSVMFYSASSFNQNLSSWSLNSSLTNAASMFVGNNSLLEENYSDTLVGWAVFVYNNSGSPSSVQWTGTKPNFDGTRTSDLASGQTYAAKYGANWTATGWTDSQDAFDYLTTTLSWTIN